MNGFAYFVENENDYSPVSAAMDEPSGNPSVGALYSGGFVVYIFEKDRVEPWLVRAMCEGIRIYREHISSPTRTYRMTYRYLI